MCARAVHLLVLPRKTFQGLLLLMFLRGGRRCSSVPLHLPLPRGLSRGGANTGYERNLTVLPGEGKRWRLTLDDLVEPLSLSKKAISLIFLLAFEGGER